jgi:hypothetical protein
MSEKREFTGVFIPAHIWESLWLAPNEKYVFVEFMRQYEMNFNQGAEHENHIIFDRFGIASLYAMSEHVIWISDALKKLQKIGLLFNVDVVNLTNNQYTFPHKYEPLQIKVRAFVTKKAINFYYNNEV